MFIFSNSMVQIQALSREWKCWLFTSHYYVAGSYNGWNKTNLYSSLLITLLYSLLFSNIWKLSLKYIHKMQTVFRNIPLACCKYKQSVANRNIDFFPKQVYCSISSWTYEKLHCSIYKKMRTNCKFQWSDKSNQIYRIAISQILKYQLIKHWFVFTYLVARNCVSTMLYSHHKFGNIHLHVSNCHCTADYCQYYKCRVLLKHSGAKFD